MPLDHSGTKASVSGNIKRLRRERMPQRQAVAVALDVARRSRQGKAEGGPTFPEMLAENPRGWKMGPALREGYQEPEDVALKQILRRARLEDAGVSPDWTPESGLRKFGKDFATDAALQLGFAFAPGVGRGIGAALKYAPKATGAAAGLLGLGSLPSGAEDAPVSAVDALSAPVGDQMKQLMSQIDTTAALRDAAQREADAESKGIGRAGGKGKDYANQTKKVDEYNRQLAELNAELGKLRRRSDPVFQANLKKTAEAEAAKNKMLTEARTPFEQAHPDLAKNWWLAPAAAGAFTAMAMRLPPALSQRLQAHRWWNAVQAAERTPKGAARDYATTLAQKYAEKIPPKTWGSHMASYGAPMGLAAVEGAGLANAPDFYNLFLPPENPERRAYEEYIKRLPEDSPEIARTRKLLEGMPPENPARKMAVEHFANIRPAIVKGIEGGLEGLFGATLMTTGVKGIGPFESGLPRAETEALLARGASRGKPPPPSLGPNGLGGDPILPLPPQPLAPKAPPMELPPPQSTAELLGSTGSALSLPARPADVSKALGVAKTPSQSAVSSPAPEATPTLEEGGSRITRRFRKHGINEWQHGEKKVLRHADGKPEGGQFASPEVIKKSKGSKADTQPKSEPVEEPKKPASAEDYFSDPTKLTSGMKTGGVISKALALAKRYANGGIVVGAVTGATGGRADKLPVNVPSGSYVIPSDCVSGIEGAGGNTLAGAKILEQMFGAPVSRASGGAVPIQISHGEFVVSPEQVAKIGGGDITRGHALLDAFVHRVRAQNIQTLRNLPSPSR